MITRYQQFLPFLSDPQTHADELTGAAGRGLFSMGGARHIYQVYCKAGSSLTWTVYEVVNGTDYQIATGTGTTFSPTINRKIPPGVSIKITSSATPGSNPSATVCSAILRESTFNT